MENKSPKNTEIQFKPLSDGLGFHPFSDGLPYAPVTKGPKTQGTGAVSAGPPGVARSITSPNPNPNSNSNKVTPKQIPQVSVPVARPDVSSEKPLQGSVQSRVPQPLSQVEEEWRPGFVYVLERMVAYFIDLFVAISLYGCGMAGLIAWQIVDPRLFLTQEILIVGTGTFLGFHLFLLVFQEMFLGTTLGKRIFKLELSGNSFSILLRSLCFVFSVGFFGLGLIWSLFDSKRRCLHDVISGIQPTSLL